MYVSLGGSISSTGNRALKYGPNGARINSQTGSVVGTAVFIVTKKFQIDRHYF